MKQWLAKIRRRGFAGCLTTFMALGVLAGCERTTFLSKEIYDQAHTGGLPVQWEKENCPVAAPISDAPPAPPTVNLPDRPQRPLTLQEAIAISLENGLPSGNSAGLGRSDDTLLRFNGPSTLNNQTDRMRVLALNPAIAAAAMEASVAKFDAVWVNSMNWSNTDNLLQGLASFNNGSNAAFNSSIIKPFAGGGVANVSFITNYQNLTTPPTGAFGLINPQYTTQMSFGFEQPLWRDFGSDINQLLSRFPTLTGNSLTSASASTGYNARQGLLSQFADRATEGILISRLRFDQNRAEFERNVNILLLNTEVAYWNLYNKYGQLYSFEENLRILHKAWRESYAQYKAGAEKGTPVQYFQILGQFEEFRGERFRALQEVLDAERNLRGILGMPVEDGCRLVPITPPTLAELKPSWESCLQDALNLRPELILARDNVKYHQYLMSIQKNYLKPDLRAYGKWEPLGFGTALAGDGGTFIDGTGTTRTNNAFSSLAGGNFANYTFGVFMNMPIGFRYEHAAIRAARLELAQSYYVLRDQEEKATRYLTNQYQDLAHWYKRIETHRSERLGYQNALKALIDQIIAGRITFTGGGNVGTLQLLQIQRSYASALVKEYAAIAEYNNVLSRLEWAKGTILRYNNVHVGEGQLPQCAEVRAVEQEKERSKALVLCNRPDSLTQPGRLCATKENDILGLPLTTPMEAPGEPENMTPPDRAAEPAERLPNLPRRLPNEAPMPNNGKAIEGKPMPAPGKLPATIKPSLPIPTGPQEKLPTSGLLQSGSAGAVREADKLLPPIRDAKELNTIMPTSSSIPADLPIPILTTPPGNTMSDVLSAPPLQPDWRPSMPASRP